MDGQRFDRVVRAMSGRATRREAIAGVMALAAGSATFGAAGVSAAKGGNGNGNGKGNGNGGGHNKVAICHKRGKNGYQFKLVPPPALKGHVKHGDQPCPANTECATYDSCDQTTGACVGTFAPAGTDCTTDAGASTCDGNGVCAPLM